MVRPEGVDMIMLHDPADTFGEAYQIMIPRLRSFARAIFVLDREGVIQHVEIVPEISHEPDYQAAIDAAKANL